MIISIALTRWSPANRVTADGHRLRIWRGVILYISFTSQETPGGRTREKPQFWTASRVFVNRKF
jgi:hypothetical protein